MKTFNNIASLVKTKRSEHHKNYSKEDLSALMGLKSESLITKIEEANCSVPLKSMSKLSQVLDISPDDFKDAILKDHEESLERYFRKTFTKI